MLLNPFTFGSGGGPALGTEFLDFFNASYTVNGSIVTAADVIDKPGWITGAGLEVLSTEASPSVALIGDALAACLADEITVVIEYYERSDSGASVPLNFSDPDDPTILLVLRRLNLSQYFDATETNAAHFREATDVFAFGMGVHKFAMSRANARLSISVDGRSVVTTTADTFSMAASAVSIGAPPDASYLAHDIYIRSVEVMALQADAALPALSVKPMFTLPGGAIASADFIAGVYKDGVTTKTLADFVDTPGAITAFGLEMPYGDVPIGIIGALGDALLTMDWTILLDYEEDNNSDITIPLAVAATALDKGVTIKRLDSPDNLVMQASDFNAVPASRTITDSHSFYSANSHLIALTRVAGRLSMSVDGNVVVTNVTSLTATADAAAFGGLPGDTTINGGYIRSLRVWSPMADSALQSLSST